MSEEVEKKTLEERLDAIEVQIHVEEAVKELTVLVHEIDSDYAELAKTVSGFGNLQDDLHRRSEDVDKIRSQFLAEVNYIRVTNDELGQQIRTAQELLSQLAKILASPTVAKLLSGIVIATRPATREELKSGEAIPVRQVTAAELREK